MDGEGEVDDVDLLRGCVEQPELFAVFYRRHLAVIVAYFRHRTACPQTAADLIAETFAAAFTARIRFVDRGVPATAWLFGIARRQLGTFQRRRRVADRARRRMGVPPLAVADPAIERLDELAELASIWPLLDAAMGTLPVGQADAIRLRVVEELPYPDVATRLGVSEGAARVRVSRGLTRLAELVEMP